jgi:glutamate dehydrogenase/leucine dehydrogenase
MDKTTALEGAAKSYAASMGRMFAAWKHADVEFTALGRECVGYIKETMRPGVPVLNALALMFQGSAEVGAWVAERLMVAAADVNAATSHRKSVNDADGVPTEAETNAALESALVAEGLSTPPPSAATEADADQEPA